MCPHTTSATDGHRNSLKPQPASWSCWGVVGAATPSRIVTNETPRRAIPSRIVTNETPGVGRPGWVGRATIVRFVTADSRRRRNVGGDDHFVGDDSRAMSWDWREQRVPSPTIHEGSRPLDSLAHRRRRRSARTPILAVQPRPGDRHQQRARSGRHGREPRAATHEQRARSNEQRAVHPPSRAPAISLGHPDSMAPRITAGPIERPVNGQLR